MSTRRSPRWSRAAPILPPLALAAFAFAVRDPQQSQEKPEETGSELRGGEPFKGPVQPALRTVVDSELERGAPILLPLAGDRVLFACVGYDASAGDRIYAGELAPDEEPRLAPIDARPSEILRPVGVLDAAGRPCLFWSSLDHGVARLVMARREEKRWTSPFPLTDGARPAFNVEAALHGDGRIWLAWQEWRPAAEKGRRGSYDVLLAPVADDKLGEPVAILADRFSEIDPALASAPDGSLWVAASSMRGRDFEILARRFDPATGKPGPTIDVSSDPLADDLHPSLAVAPGGDLWIAWDSMRDSLLGVSHGITAARATAIKTASVRVAAVRGDRVLVPAIPATADAEAKPLDVVPGVPLLSWSGGLPRIRFDAAGRLRLVHRFLDRTPDALHFTYPVLAQTLTSEGWHASLLEESGGAPEEAAMVATPGATWIAWQQDRRGENTGMRLTGRMPGSQRRGAEAHGVHLRGWNGPSGIGLARIESGAGATTTLPPLVPRVATASEPRVSPLGAPELDPILSGDEHFEIQDGEKTYRVYWGDLHRHSSVSRCSRGMEPRPEQRYEFGRDLFLFDFFALTDHSVHCDAFAWWQLDKLVDLFQAPDFVSLQGFEYSPGLDGHQNVILRDRLHLIWTSALVREDPHEELWKNLPVGAAITIPHHSADTTKFFDWSHQDPRFQKLVEVYQARRGNYEFDGCFLQASGATVKGSFVQDGLKRGLEVGFISSSDHGNGTSYAAVLADELSRHGIFDALMARRTYGATTKGILVDFRVDGHLMGSSFRASAPPRVHLKLRGTAELADVVVFRDGEPWRRVRGATGGAASPHSPTPIAPDAVSATRDADVDVDHGLGVRELEQEWIDDALPAGHHYYYARLVQTNSEMAWSSPVYVTRE